MSAGDMYGHVIGDFRASNLGTLRMWFRQGTVVQLRHAIPAFAGTIASGDPPNVFYGHDGACPPGTYELGDPEINEPDDPEYPAEGRFFTPLIDTQGRWNAPPVPAGTTRSLIGVHAGRAALWPAKTLGCTRLRDADNEAIFAPFVQYIRAHGGRVDYTVLR